MFAGRTDAKLLAAQAANKLADHGAFLSHGRPIDIAQARAMKLEVRDLSETPAVQALFWELYCRIELLFDGSPWLKVFVSKNFMTGKMLPLQQVVELQRVPASPSSGKPQPQLPSAPVDRHKRRQR